MLVVGIVTIICFLLKGSQCLDLASTPSIIIVGSGPAGIAAATKLLKNNFTDIKILEAENRIGGRIHSVNFGTALVDLGAEFCHGEDGNIVYSMVKDFNILKHSRNKSQFFYSNGERIDQKTSHKILEFSKELFADDEINDNCKNANSVGECLDIRHKSFPATGQDEKEKEILNNSYDFTYSFLCSYDSPLDLNDLNITSDYIQCEGDLGLNWNGLGYKTILEVMMQKYPNNENQLPIDDKIILGKEVCKVSNWQTEGKVTVSTKDGGIYEADHVIFTPSLGVLKANHKSMFEPTLPEDKINAIKNIGFGGILKIIMHFPEIWWNDGMFWSFIWAPEDRNALEEKSLDWLISLSNFVPAENNPNVLIAWFAGRHIPRIEKLSQETILEGLKYIINKFLAPHYNVSSMPDKIIRTTWITNPNFRGTYSYESVKGHSKGGKHFQLPLGKPLKNLNDKPTVLFAGEATHPYYFSTVHGAIETGYREAARLVQLYKQ